MACVLRHVEIYMPRDTAEVFRTVSRTGRGSGGDDPAGQRHPMVCRRTLPQRCPVCGTCSGSGQVFKKEGELFQCTICGTKIKENGSIISEGGPKR